MVNQLYKAHGPSSLRCALPKFSSTDSKKGGGKWTKIVMSQLGQILRQCAGAEAICVDEHVCKDPHRRSALCMS